MADCARAGANGGFCEAGACQSFPCLPGEIGCPDGEAGHPYRCDEQGVWSDQTDTCTTNEYCAGGTCLADSCTAGEPFCLGGTTGDAYLCSSSGASAELQDDCGDDEHCLAGKCVLDGIFASPDGGGTVCTAVAPCSLLGARDRARELRATMTRDLFVHLRGGRYVLSEPFTLSGSLDSGLNGHRIALLCRKGLTTRSRDDLTAAWGPIS